MEVLRLKEVLKEKGMSGKDLAEKTGVTAATISNIANGNHFPKPELLHRIAEVLDVDVRQLFKPTKEGYGEAIYIQREGKFINIGEITLNLKAFK